MHNLRTVEVIALLMVAGLCLIPYLVTYGFSRLIGKIITRATRRALSLINKEAEHV